ncbi:transketolase C-terminal domain-containing protein [Geobacter sp.]|uniref:transketolase family protein n=1 Tax=Geobacter sp. TaxID=46610 RepID=UPI00262D7A04|nr:transketolase C-terminal domain-containing protein [Geobacter sp.]
MTQPARAMRDAFIEALYDRMAENERIFFLAADLGSPALDRLRADFPERFINVGIAEQNLINVATGLALEGGIVYAYAIAPFIAMRAYEQIRVNLSISSQVRPVNVNLIGVGGGVSYQVSGPTHHCLEDLAIMRLLPNMAVFSPSDWRLAAAFVDYTVSNCTPKYLRFDGKPIPAIYETVTPETLTAGFCELVAGTEACIVSTGFMTQRALSAARSLGSVGVVDLFLLKPANTGKLRQTLLKYRHIVTAEEGFVGNGGLDSLVAQLLNEDRRSVTLDHIGFNDRYVFELGTRDYLHARNGMDESAIMAAVTRRLGHGTP